MTDKKKRQNSNNIAAIDLGTNSCRILIANSNGTPIFRDVRHVALGEKLAESGNFCEEAMNRAVCSFIDFSKAMKKYNIKKYRAIATAACRMSSNTHLLLENVKDASEIDIDVISEYEEARLTLKGAKLNAPKDKKYLFVYDLGGGSTEVTFATNEESPKILSTISIPLGARNATEIFGLENYDELGATRLTEAVNKYMSRFMDSIKDYNYQENTALIATSSTPLRLAAWIRDMKTYDKFAADGVTVSTNEIDNLITHIMSLDYKTRLNSVYIGKCRAGIFIAALIIFQTIYQSLGIKTLTASLKSAQEAIISELLED